MLLSEDIVMIQASVWAVKTPGGGFVLTRFLLPFHRLEKEEPVRLEDEGGCGNPISLINCFVTLAMTRKTFTMILISASLRGGGSTTWQSLFIDRLLRFARMTEGTRRRYEDVAIPL